MPASNRGNFSLLKAEDLGIPLTDSTGCGRNRRELPGGPLKRRYSLAGDFQNLAYAHLASFYGLVS